MHLEVKKLVASFAGILGTVHCRISIAQYVIGLVIFGRAQRNANAGRGKCFMSAQFKRPQQFFLDLFGNANRITGILDSIKENRKLIASKTRDGIDLAQAALQPSRKLDDQLISAAMSQTIVDVFEPIKIEKQNREEIVALAFAAFDGQLQIVREQTTIGQVRQ